MKVVRKVKLGSIEVMLKVIDKLITAKLGVKVDYWLGRNVRSIKPDFDFVTQKKTELLRECAQLDEKGGFVLTEDKNGVMLSVEKKDQYWESVAGLLMTEVEVDVWPIKLEMIEKADLTYGETQAISVLLEEEDA